LDVTDEDDGITVTYSWRAGTDASDAATKAFATISPGSLIPAPNTDTVIQIRAQTNNTGVLDDVDLLDATVNYTQGGTPSQTIYGGSWENRYWVSATSGTEATNNNVVFVKSRDSASWTKHDLEIGPMTV
ncbi:MAG: hypothetical protein GTO63_14000, partial [Anaerolineae bacterium]|nr:hypothetical protein [Anaerolineae bacterium]NIQ78921.1 hypothetical protein [Anaerolineae bacterium]